MLAAQCLRDGDVPVGCVIVSPDERIIGRGRNRNESERNALSHAELEAISQACHTMNSWRLTNCVLYVTLEPCPMCAGAIINSRIAEIHYAAREDQSGCCGSVLNLFEERFHHHPRIYGGLFAKASQCLLESFFQDLRNSESFPEP